MPTIKIRKLIGWTLVLLVSYFLLCLSTTFPKLEYGFVYNKDSEQSPLAVSNEATPQTVPRDVLRPKGKHNSPEPMDTSRGDAPNLSVDIPPPKTNLEPTEKYLGYLPYAGLTNQVWRTIDDVVSSRSTSARL